MGRRTEGRDRRLLQGKPDVTAAGGADESGHGHRAAARDEIPRRRRPVGLAAAARRPGTPRQQGGGCWSVRNCDGRSSSPRKAKRAPGSRQVTVSFDGPDGTPVASRGRGVAAKSPETARSGQVLERHVKLPARPLLHVHHCGVSADPVRQPSRRRVYSPRVGDSPVAARSWCQRGAEWAPVAAGTGYLRARGNASSARESEASRSIGRGATPRSGDPDTGHCLRVKWEIDLATLLVANAGGHLQELLDLFPRF